MVSVHDREVLRRLAGEIAELAQRPEQQEKIDGWKRINSLQAHRSSLLPIPAILGGYIEYNERLSDLKNDRYGLVLTP